MNDIGRRIKALREESGLTQLQLADRIGCSGQVISNIERGYSQPAADIVNKIAAYFRVPGDYVLGLTTSRWIAESPVRTSADIPDKIASRMDQLQMDQQALSSAVEISPEECEEILTGRVIPNISVLSRMAAVLRTSTDYLIGSSKYAVAIASEEEQDIICYFRQMSKKQKRVFMGMLEQIM